MTTFANGDRIEELEALRRERARQDEQLAEATRRLTAGGATRLAVPCGALLAIEEACLVSTSSLTHTALRA